MPFTTNKLDSIKRTLLLSLVTLGVFIALPARGKSLVLVGGALQYPATGDPDGISIYQKIIDLAGGTRNAKIGIFTTASSSGESAKENGKLWIEDFQALGVTDIVWIPIHTDNCKVEKNNPAIVSQIKSRTGFMFGGGDQSLITQCFFNENSKGTRTDSPAMVALRSKYEQGAVVAGTSAGTAVQTGAPMITEGESYEALLKGPTSLIGPPPVVRELYYNPLGGLGFFNYGLTDTHFSERGRQGRIIRLASDLKKQMAYGVDENTALVVTNADTPKVNMEVIGQGGTFIFDLSRARPSKRTYWSIFGVAATYLTQEDRFNPLTKKATIAKWKSSLTGRERFTSVTPSTDIFSSLVPEPPPDQGRANPRAFVNTATYLFDSHATTAKGRSFESNPVPYNVRLTKSRNAGSQGFLGKNRTGTLKYSFQNLIVDITSGTSFMGAGL